MKQNRIITEESLEFCYSFVDLATYWLRAQVTWFTSRSAKVDVIFNTSNRKLVKTTSIAASFVQFISLFQYSLFCSFSLTIFNPPLYDKSCLRGLSYEPFSLSIWFLLKSLLITWLALVDTCIHIKDGDSDRTYCLPRILSISCVFCLIIEYYSFELMIYCSEYSISKQWVTFLHQTLLN